MKGIHFQGLLSVFLAVVSFEASGATPMDKDLALGQAFCDSARFEVHAKVTTLSNVKPFINRIDLAYNAKKNVHWIEKSEYQLKKNFNKKMCADWYGLVGVRFPQYLKEIKKTAPTKDKECFKQVEIIAHFQEGKKNFYDRVQVCFRKDDNSSYVRYIKVMLESLGNLYTFSKEEVAKR